MRGSVVITVVCLFLGGVLPIGLGNGDGIIIVKYE